MTHLLIPSRNEKLERLIFWLFAFHTPCLTSLTLAPFSDLVNLKRELTSLEPKLRENELPLLQTLEGLQFHVQTQHKNGGSLHSAVGKPFYPWVSNASKAKAKPLPLSLRRRCNTSLIEDQTDTRLVSHASVMSEGRIIIQIGAATT